MGIETSGNIDIIAFSEHGDWYNWSFYLPLANSWHGMSIASSGFTAPKSFWPWECYGDWLGTDVRERELAILYNVCVCVCNGSLYTDVMYTSRCISSLFISGKYFLVKYNLKD